jgi:hypothetical protein
MDCLAVSPRWGIRTRAGVLFIRRLPLGGIRRPDGRDRSIARSPSRSLQNANKSSLTCSFSVAHRPCEPPLYLQGRALDELGLERAGIGERHDVVVVALHDECRYVDLLEVPCLIRLGERLNAKVSCRETGHSLKFATRRSFSCGRVVGCGLRAQPDRVVCSPVSRRLGIQSGASIGEAAPMLRTDPNRLIQQSRAKAE